MMKLYHGLLVIIDKVEEKLGVKAPEKVKAQGKEFCKWVDMTITGAKKDGTWSAKLEVNNGL